MPTNLMTLATFRGDFDSFSTADDALVQRYLDKAAEQFDPGIWGTYLETGHGLLTAHMLAVAPNGEFARLNLDKVQSTYGDQFRDLLRAVTCAIRVF